MQLWFYKYSMYPKRLITTGKNFNRIAAQQLRWSGAKSKFYT